MSLINLCYNLKGGNVGIDPFENVTFYIDQVICKDWINGSLYTMLLIECKGHKVLMEKNIVCMYKEGMHIVDIDLLYHVQLGQVNIFQDGIRTLMDIPEGYLLKEKDGRYFYVPRCEGEYARNEFLDINDLDHIFYSIHETLFESENIKFYRLKEYTFPCNLVIGE